MAENILAAACESESRKAAKRMRLDVYQAHVSSVVEVCVMQVLVNLVDVSECYFVSLYFKTKWAWYICLFLSQEDPVSLEKVVSREPVSLTQSAYSLAASAYSQDQLYINGGLNYSYRGYGGLCASMQHPVSLTTATAQTNGERKLAAS